MTDSIVLALRGVQVSVKTSLSLVHMKSMPAAVMQFTTVRSCVVPTITLKAPGCLARTIKLPRVGSSPSKKPPRLSPIERAILLTTAGRTRVDMSVPGRRSALAAASALVMNRVSSAVTAAAASKPFQERFGAARKKPERDAAMEELKGFFQRRKNVLRQSDVLECWRTVWNEDVVRGVLDS